jgi:hypothetical protein
MNARLWKALGLVAILTMVGGAVMLNAPSTASATTKTDRVGFQMDMRKLWEDHITWTRVVIISVFASLPDRSAATNRLLQNQVDIGNAIKPFYGDAAGNQLTSLLTTHIVGAAQILDSMKATAPSCTPDPAAVARWYANGNDIAAFLHAANPTKWPLAEVQQMMKSHLDLTAAEATARCKMDWNGDVAAYDRVHLEILQMADMLSQGIIRQFPQKFN